MGLALLCFLLLESARIPRARSPFRIERSRTRLPVGLRSLMCDNTLYRPHFPMKIWPTYAVLPVTMLYLRSIYDLWRAWSYPTILQPVERILEFILTGQSGPDQSSYYYRQTYAFYNQGTLIDELPFFSRAGDSGAWSALWCERGFRVQQNKLKPNIFVRQSANKKL